VTIERTGVIPDSFASHLVSIPETQIFFRVCMLTKGLLTGTEVRPPATVKVVFCFQLPVISFSLLHAHGTHLIYSCLIGIFVGQVQTVAPLSFSISRWLALVGTNTVEPRHQRRKHTLSRALNPTPARPPHVTQHTSRTQYTHRSDPFPKPSLSYLTPFNQPPLFKA
jgi:hypothetical protein